MCTMPMAPTFTILRTEQRWRLTPPPASSILNIDVTAPVGVGVDAFGNLIVTDQSVTTNNVTTGDNRLIEIPKRKRLFGYDAAVRPLAYLYSANGVSVDQLGNIYYGGYNANILPRAALQTALRQLRS